MSRIAACKLAGGRGFLPGCAEHIVSAESARLPDLSSVWVWLPSSAAIPDWSKALVTAAGRGLLLPRMVTHGGLALQPEWVSARVRRLRLYAALRARAWLPDAASRWAAADELVALFDELTDAHVALSANAEQFIASVSDSYRLAENRVLGFEARLTYELWQADTHMGLSQVAAERIRLHHLARSAPGPLYMVLDAPAEAAQSRFMELWSERAVVTVLEADRGELPSLDSLCQRAWSDTEHDTMPLIVRAESARTLWPQTPFGSGRLTLMPCPDLETEARVVAHQVETWLDAGRRHIALIALDRECARRARALLERSAIRVEDETGWRLATTRAAHLIDAWFEWLATDGHHLALLDLIKSPFFRANLEEGQHDLAVAAIESCVRTHGIVGGLDALSRALMKDAAYGDARPMVLLLRQAGSMMPIESATLCDWLERLQAVLDHLGALEALVADAAGRSLHAWLDEVRAESSDLDVRLDFTEFRRWVDSELDEARFRDETVSSSVRMTSLEAARLRDFDAALLVGADQAHLDLPRPAGLIGHAGLRATLGLKSPAEARRRRGLALASLIARADTVLATWQERRNNEANLPAREFAQLALLSHIAWGDDLIRPAPSRQDPQAHELARPATEIRVAVEVFPVRVSPSQVELLAFCPYRFAVATALGLSELDDVAEELDHRATGQRLHEILYRFHSAFPDLLAPTEIEACAALENLARAAFAEDIEDSWNDFPRLARFLRRVSAYVRGQREWAAHGWRPEALERRLTCLLALGDGDRIELVGRIDRVDRRVEGGHALIDYKNQTRKALIERIRPAERDVQLALYAWLFASSLAGGEVDPESEAAERVCAAAALDRAVYLPLREDGACTPVELPDIARLARSQAARLKAALVALRNGAPARAFPAERHCRHCAYAGLCRKDYLM
ncbi:MAG: hypothetical protein AMXMBFR6_20830 [Betaproteobacteria bacterium]